MTRAFERFNYPNFSLGIDHWTEQKAQENVADRRYAACDTVHIR